MTHYPLAPLGRLLVRLGAWLLGVGDDLLPPAPGTEDPRARRTAEYWEARLVGDRMSLNLRRALRTRDRLSGGQAPHTNGHHRGDTE